MSKKPVMHLLITDKCDRDCKDCCNKQYDVKSTPWAEECDFGYDQMPDEYEKYKNAIENMGYCEGLIYIAINEAEEKLEHDS